MTEQEREALASADIDPDVDPEDVERYGADSRGEHDDEVDLEALERQAIADADREQPDEGEDAEEHL